MRLFIAMAVPELVKEKLREVQRELQQILRKASIRWTPSEQMHLTLRFFGNVAAEQLDWLQSALRAACETSPALSLQARGLGVFPPKRAPRVIWVGVRDRGNRLDDVQKVVQTATCDFGEKPETRDFSAHLTLARVKEIQHKDERVLREFLANHANRDCGSWTVNQIELVQSQLGSSGPTHSVLSQYALRSL